MTPKDDLFRLIKSLSKNEKGYFKKHSVNSTTSKDSNYLKLFDAIDKQTEYDEQSIKKKFRNEKFIKQLHVAKNYLFGIILDSLESYHSSLDSELQSQLNRLGILYEKGFYEMCESIVTKTKEKATEHEKFSYVIQCLNWEKNLVCCGARPSATESDFNSLIEQGDEALRLLKNTYEFNTLRDRMYFQVMKSGIIRNKDQQSKFDNIMKDPLLQDEKNALTIGNKFMYNSVLDMYNYYSTNGKGLDRGIQYKKRLLELIESNPNSIRTRPKTYYAILMDLLSYYSEKIDSDDFFIYLEKIRSIDKNYQVTLSDDLQAKIFFGSYTNELNFYLLLHQFDKINTCISDIEKGIKKFDLIHFDPKKLFLHYNVAYMNFGCGDYKAALKWLNRILNNQSGNNRPDLICFSKILLLLVHYELENIDILPYLISSTERFLAKQKRYYKYETTLISFFKRTLKVKSKEQLKVLYNETNANLLEIIKDPFEKKACCYFDFLSWFQSKISGRSFEKVQAELL